MKQKIQTLQTYYAAALADTTLRYGKAGILDEVTAQKRAEQMAGGAMWLQRILPPLLDGTIPESVEHYTTLIIQAMDLGIVIPAMLVAGILTLKRNPTGYFPSVLLSVKALILLTSITAMMINMGSHGVPPTYVEIFVFGIFNLVALANVLIAVKSVNQPSIY